MRPWESVARLAERAGAWSCRRRLLGSGQIRGSFGEVGWRAAMRHAPRPRVRSAVPRTFGHGCAFCAERALPSGFSARRDLSSGILADHRNFVQQLAQDFASRRGALKTSGLGSLSRPSTARTARTACSQNRKPASADGRKFLDAIAREWLDQRDAANAGREQVTKIMHHDTYSSQILHKSPALT